MRRLSGCRPPRGPEGTPFPPSLPSPTPPVWFQLCAVASVSAELGSIWRWAGLEKRPWSWFRGPWACGPLGCSSKRQGPSPAKKEAGLPSLGRGREKNFFSEKKKARRAKEQMATEGGLAVAFGEGLSCVSLWVGVLGPGPVSALMVGWRHSEERGARACGEVAKVPCLHVPD